MDNYFSSNLKKIRENRGLSQNKFAELLNINQSNILRWEDGSRTPGIDAAIDISNKLKIPLGVLIGEDLSLKENIFLDEQNKLDWIITDKTKALSDEDKKKIIDIIDIYNK